MSGDDRGEFSKERLLRSWKEISAYLGCDVRTCHRWEDERGMPIHRAETGKKKSPVFAYRDELDAWFRETFRNSSETTYAGSRAVNGRSGTREERGSRRPWLKWAAVGAAVLILAGAGAFLLLGRNRQPADFTIDGSFFVALDKHRRELWRHDTKLDGLMPESFFRAQFQTLSHEPANSLPSIIIKDINADGDKEVLFTPKTKEEMTGSGHLYCFDRTGGELWHFDAGQELHCAGITYSPDYRIPGFFCHDVDGDGRLETLVFAYHRPDWPCQMTLLDASGRKRGEFWNAGQLKFPVFYDLNGDGREELLVLGLNNEYRGGCLIVFDTRRISGASPQSGKFACREFEPGSELFYVTAPLSDVSKASGGLYDAFAYAFMTENGRISATYMSDLIFEFDFGLRCLQVTYGHGYELKHGEMVKAGKITSVLDPEYLAQFRDGVRYWDGSAMVATPTPVKR